MSRTITITLDKGNKRELLLTALRKHYESIAAARDNPNNSYWKKMNTTLADQVQEMYEEVENQ